MGKARVIGIGMDYSPTSKAALRWAADNIIQEGDLIILIHVQPPKSDHTRKKLFEDTGSSSVSTSFCLKDLIRHFDLLPPIFISLSSFVFAALVPLEEFREINFSKQYGLTYDPEVLEILDSASKTKGAKVVAKVYWGDPREKLCDAAEDLKLDSLVVGSRGLGPIKRVLLGSVSKYVVTNASCPVTVVKGTQFAKP